MSLATISSGTRVFIDANVFVYHFTNSPVFGEDCGTFLQRIPNRDIEGLTSATVLSEVAHRLMTIEACDTFGWPYSGIAQRLAKHPKELMTLHRYRDAVTSILSSGIMVVAVSKAHSLRGTDLSQRFGVLSNDALILAVMESEDITTLASNDAVFDRVSTITGVGPV